MITAGLVWRNPFPTTWYLPGPPAKQGELDHTTADEVGLMLTLENHLSVNHRYVKASHIPEAIPDETFVYERPKLIIDPVKVLKAIDCYEYQSCEHPDWKTSEAKAFCRALRGRAISSLPGYENSDWEVR